MESEIHNVSSLPSQASWTITEYVPRLGGVGEPITLLCSNSTTTSLKELSPQLMANPELHKGEAWFGAIAPPAVALADDSESFFPGKRNNSSVVLKASWFLDLVAPLARHKQLTEQQFLALRDLWDWQNSEWSDGKNLASFENNVAVKSLRTPRRKQITFIQSCSSWGAANSPAQLVPGTDKPILLPDASEIKWLVETRKPQGGIPPSYQKTPFKLSYVEFIHFLQHDVTRRFVGRVADAVGWKESGLRFAKMDEAEFAGWARKTAFAPLETVKDRAPAKAFFAMETPPFVKGAHKDTADDDDFDDDDELFTSVLEQQKLQEMADEEEKMNALKSAAKKAKVADDGEAAK